MLNRGSLATARNAIRSYMSLSEDDNVDLAVMAAIISNFAPDRINPLWFVLVGSSEAGKSLLLDVILDDWQPVWRMTTALSLGYFFSARTDNGALYRIQQERKRILYMRDMTTLTSVPMTHKAQIHNQIIGIYDGEYRHETGLNSRPQVYTAEPRDRLGWIGGATEAFYDRFLKTTVAAGSRFTAYYWSDPRPHWTNHEHLAKQRELRGHRLAQFRQTRETVQAFLSEAVTRMGSSWPQVQIGTAQGKRIDAATTLAMRIIGTGKSTPRGGRTADRAAQFSRAVAYLCGDRTVQQHHCNLGVRLALSQLPVEYQQLVGYALREENIRDFWTFQDFLVEVGGRRGQYSNGMQGGPLENLLDIGVLRKKGGGKGWQGKAKYKITEDAFKLAAIFDPKCAELRRQITTQEAPPIEEPKSDDDPAEINLDELEAM